MNDKTLSEISASRDAAYKPRLAVAALAVHEAEDVNPIEQDARVQRLIDLLVATENMTEDQGREAWYEPNSREHDVVDLFYEGGCTRVGLDGDVEFFEVD